MALLFCDSFDHYTTVLQKWTVMDTATISAGNGRNGTASLRFARMEHYARKTLGVNAQTLVVGIACRVSSILAGCLAIGFMDAGLWQCEVRINALGQLTICRNATVLATSANSLLINTYYYIEFKVYIHDAAGSAEIKVNGISWASVAGADTKNTVNAYANQVQIGAGGGVGSASIGDYDDLYVCDNAGVVNNDYLGDVRVQAILPDGAGGNTEWDPSAGANWQCVDEVPPNEDVDYVYTSVAGERDSYTFVNLIPVAGSINAVVIYPRSRKDDAGARTVAPVVRIGGINYDGIGQAIGNSYAYYPQIYETSPATIAAWTIAEINGAEFGVKLVA